MFAGFDGSNIQHDTTLFVRKVAAHFDYSNLTN